MANQAANVPTDLNAILLNSLKQNAVKGENSLKGAVSPEGQILDPELLAQSEEFQKLLQAKELQGEGDAVKIVNKIPNEGGLNILQDVDANLETLKAQGKDVVTVGGRVADITPADLQAIGLKSEVAKKSTGPTQMEQAYIGDFDPVKVANKRRSIFNIPQEKAIDLSDPRFLVKEESPGLEIGLAKKDLKNLQMQGMKNNLAKNQMIQAFGKEQKALGDNVINFQAPNQIKASKLGNESNPISKLGNTEQILMPEITELPSSNRMPVNLNLGANIRPNMQAANTVEATPIFQMTDNSMVSADNAQIIERVSDYITQKSFSSQKEIQLNVSHKDLGDFLIRVAKEGNQAAGKGINIQITTATNEGRDFFTNNQGRLLSSLSASGLNVTDLKLDSSSDSSSQFSQNSESGNQRGNQSQTKQDSERRRNLWQQFNQQQERAA